MADQDRGPLQAKRGSAADWAATTVPLLSGEWGYDETNGISKIGNGSSLWNDLPVPDVGLVYDPATGLFSAGGGQALPTVDPSTGVLTPSVQAALDALNNGKFQTLQNVYVWSMANNPAGPGPGGIIIDPTAAPNVVRDTTAKRSEGYIAMGRDALGAATRARACIAIGSLALGIGNPGFGNLALGAFALSNVQGISEFAADLPGSRNIGIGSLAGYFISSGYMNTFVGRDAGQTATTGLRNVGIGYGAFSRGIAPVGIDGTIVNEYPTTGSDNTAVGTQASGMLAGSNTVAVGSMAASNVRASDNNVFIGGSVASALGSTTSENNFAISAPNTTGSYVQAGNVITVTAVAHGASVGKRVGVTFTSGQISTITGEMQWLMVAAVGSADTFTLVSPVSQTASGTAVLNRVETTTAQQVVGANVVIGFQAQADATTTSGNNVYVGEQTARGATGANNTTLGSRAGFNMTTGQQNTFLGFNAGRALSTGGGLTTTSNCSVIGYNAGPSGDNQVQLGDSRTTTYVFGTVQNRSDARDKADIRDTQLGLEWIVGHPRPKDFRWDMRDDYVERDEDGAIVATHERDGSQKRERFHHGVIAQEVEAYIEETGVDFGGFQDHERAGGSPVKSIGYDEYVGTLIAAIQDLHGIVQQQGEQIAALQRSAGK